MRTVATVYVDVSRMSLSVAHLSTAGDLIDITDDIIVRPPTDLNKY